MLQATLGALGKVTHDTRIRWEITGRAPPWALVTTITRSASAFSLAAMRMRCAALISFIAVRTFWSGSMSVTCRCRKGTLMLSSNTHLTACRCRCARVSSPQLSENLVHHCYGKRHQSLKRTSVSMIMKPNDSMLFCRASFTSAAISVLACKVDPP